MLLADVATAPSGRTDSHLRPALYLLHDPDVAQHRGSQKLNLYDVEIQLPTNQKRAVAPYRREEGRRGSCVGCQRPVVSGLGCVLF